MSIEQIKKSAKNLQRLLPAFVEKNRPPYPLTSMHQLVCQMNGYPNMEVAHASAERQEDDGRDAISRFYRYPWMEVDPNRVLSSLKGTAGITLRFAVVASADAVEWFRREIAGISQGEALIVIAAAASGGHDPVGDIKRFIDASDRTTGPRFAMSSFAHLSQRVGLAVNWFYDWSPEDVKSVLKEIVRPACSKNQFAACDRTIDLIVDQADRDLPPVETDDDDSELVLSARFDISVLANKLCSLLALSNRGWSKDHNIDLASEFDDDDDDPAPKLLSDYDSQDLVNLLGPLESLLVRLSALDNGTRCTTFLGFRPHVDNLEFGTAFGAVNFVTVDMGSKRLDHIMSIAVLAKAAATIEDPSRFPNESSRAHVVLVTR